MSCDKAREKLKALNKRDKLAAKRAKHEFFNSMLLTGCGSALKYIMITRYKANSCWGCHKTAKEMDAIDAMGVLKRKEEFALKLQNNAKEQRWTALLDSMAGLAYGDSVQVYSSLIEEAVQMHTTEVERKKRYREGIE